VSGDVVIRQATRADVGTLLDLIRGLAAYERLDHEVEATEQRLLTHGFDAGQAYEALLAEGSAQRALGFALYFFTFSTFKASPTLYLEDLFVRPDERGRGVGRRLLTALARIAVERGCGRMEWSVLDWNSPARDFYLKLGAVPMDEWTVFRLTPEAFGRLAAESDRARRE
jgi:GNAT superfamily N-acetyltransferase